MGKINVNIVVFIFFVGYISQGCTSDYVVSLGHGYIFCNEGEALKFIYHEQSVGGEIPPTVLEYKFNKKFIIVKQKLRKIQKEDSVSYFIILKDVEKIYGPYTFNEYINEKMRYKIDLSFSKE